MAFTFKVMDQSTLRNDMLNDFNRFQETSKVKFMENGSLIEKDISFIDEWDQKRKEEIIEGFKVLDGVVLFLYDDDKVIGFSSLERMNFYNYINLQYMHISREYRNKKLGRKLFYEISKEAYKLGAERLYISAHPAIETQGFYFTMGCTLVEHINEKKLAIEPYDIQMEYDLIAFKLEEMAQTEFDNLGRVTATNINKVANKLYKHVPKNHMFNHVIEYFISIERYGFFSVGTSWVKKNKEAITKENISFYEKVLYKHIYGWARVDQFCYRIMNPLIELDDKNYDLLLKWSKSENKDIRRTALVSMIRSSGKLTLEYDYDKMIHLVDKLKHDEDIHVRKAVGWVLKCAFVTYPDKVEKYLRDNVSNLDRLIYRYALEHVKNPLRKELMSL